MLNGHIPKQLHSIVGLIGKLLLYVTSGFYTAVEVEIVGEQMRTLRESRVLMMELRRLILMIIWTSSNAKGTRTQSYYQYKIDTYDGDVNILLDLLEFFIQ